MTMTNRTELEFLERARNRIMMSDLSDEDRARMLELLKLLTESLSRQDGDTQPIMVSSSPGDLLPKSQLLTIIRQQAAELDALKRISFSLTSSLNLVSVLGSLVREGMKLVKDARDVHIFLYDNDELTFGASLDRDGTENRVIKLSPEGLMYTVARTGEMMVVNNLQQSNLYKSVPHLDGSIIVIPLMMTGRVIGVMNMSRLSIGGFSPSELRLLQLLAEHAAVAIMNARLHQSAADLARRDTLTGLPNRRALDERLDQELHRAERHKHPFAIFMMDLDGFKKLNDNFGHAFGDDVLRGVAHYIAEGIRASDFLARYGGDELTMILPETDLEGARAAAELLRHRMSNYTIGLPDGNLANVQLSGGIALYPTHGISTNTLLRAADEALYHAKKHARGKLVVARAGTGELFNGNV
jgi:diguanylate cyclase (GGDEF)-like protein